MKTITLAKASIVANPMTGSKSPIFPAFAARKRYLFRLFLGQIVGRDKSVQPRRVGQRHLAPELTQFGDTGVSCDNGAVGHTNDHSVAKARAGPEVQQFICARTLDHGAPGWATDATCCEQQRNQDRAKKRAHDKYPYLKLPFGVAGKTSAVKQKQV